MRASLVRVKADGSAHAAPVRTSPTVLGRHEDCQIQIPIGGVSRRHCEIRLEGKRLVLNDLGSSNGTYLNRERIEKSTPLDPGDLISLGGLVFVVRIDGDPEHIDAPLCYEDGLPLPESPSASGSGSAIAEPDAKPAGRSPDAPAPAGRGSLLDEELGEGASDLDDSSVLDFDFDLDEDDALGRQPEL